MKSKPPLNGLLAIILLGFGAPILCAAGAAAEATPPEDHTAEYKTLDNDFARLDKLFAEYNDPVHKLTILGYINLMKARAATLGWKDKNLAEGEAGPYGGGGGRGGRGGEPPAKPEFDQVKFDELRYDINLQAQRLANYMAPLRTPPPAPQSERSIELSVARLNPSPASPAEVKAALEVLDREIKRLEDRTGTMMIGSMARDAETVRISRIKERRVALGKEFTKARWDALVGDLKP